MYSLRPFGKAARNGGGQIDPNPPRHVGWATALSRWAPRGCVQPLGFPAPEGVGQGCWCGWLSRRLARAVGAEAPSGPLLDGPNGKIEPNGMSERGACKGSPPVAPNTRRPPPPPFTTGGDFAGGWKRQWKSGQRQTARRRRSQPQEFSKGVSCSLREGSNSWPQRPRNLCPQALNLGARGHEQRRLGEGIVAPADSQAWPSPKGDPQWMPSPGFKGPARKTPMHEAPHLEGKHCEGRWGIGRGWEVGQGARATSKEGPSAPLPATFRCPQRSASRARS